MWTRIRKYVVFLSYVALISVIISCGIVIPIIAIERYMPYKGYATKDMSGKIFKINNKDMNAIVENVKNNHKKILHYIQSCNNRDSMGIDTSDLLLEQKHNSIYASVAIVRNGKVEILPRIYISGSTATCTYFLGKHTSMIDYNNLLLMEAIIFEGINYKSPPPIADIMMYFYNKVTTSLCLLLGLAAAPFVIALFVVLKLRYI